MGKPSFVELFDRAIANPGPQGEYVPAKERKAKERKEAAIRRRVKASIPDLDLDYVKPRRAFRLHQCYESPAEMKEPICTKCKTRDFDVGCGSYFTVLRCRTCRAEVCIHDG